MNDERTPNDVLEDARNELQCHLEKGIAGAMQGIQSMLNDHLDDAIVSAEEKIMKFLKKRDDIIRDLDEQIIDIVRSVMDNGTGGAETRNEHVLIKLMQIRGTPMTSFSFNQEQVDFYYELYASERLNQQRRAS